MDEAALPSRRDLWIHMLVYPGHTLPTALAPVLVAAGLAFHDGVFAAGPALLALLAGWLVQLGGVLTDNYENLVRHPSDREHPQLVRALRELIRCIDKEVYKAAVRHVDDDGFTGDAA